MVAAVVAACTDDHALEASTATASTSSTTTEPGAPSIVVLGDSVASGEGLADGYRYHLDRTDPDRSSWEGGTDDPRWLGPYPRCHQDAGAYPFLVAREVGAGLATFACTGATYLAGITAPETDDQGDMRPAQFGDWTTATGLNAAYDAANPDVVVVTLGADDVEFSSIVRYCVSGYTTAESAAVAALAASTDVVGSVLRSLVQRAPGIADALRRGDDALRADWPSSYCTAEHPGEPIQRLFWDRIDSGEVADHYRELVAAIQARGRDPRYGRGKVPRIVFTTYHRPLPAGLDGDCWDAFPLSAAEQSYLESLQATMQSTLESAVSGMPGVSVADLSHVMDGHRWCSADPWTYGLSVVWFDDPSSMAPVHPTPEGQRAIAGAVAPVVRAALAGRGPRG